MTNTRSHASLRSIARVAVGVGVAFCAVSAALTAYLAGGALLRAIADAEFFVRLPMQAPLPDDAVAGPIVVERGTLSQAEVLGRGFEPATLTALVIGDVLGALATIAVLVAAALLLLGGVGRTPAGRLPLRSGVVAAVASLVALTGGTLSSSIGTWLAASELSDGDPELGPFTLGLVPVDQPFAWLVPVVLVALLLIRRLRRETDGSV